MLVCYVLHVVNYVLVIVKQAKYFSLIVDSTPEPSRVDQLAIVIRYVKEGGSLIERFSTFLPNTGHKAENIFNDIINIFESNGLFGH